MDAEQRMAEIERRPTVYCKGYTVLYAKDDVPWLLAELRRARTALAPFALMADIYDADPNPLPDSEGLVGHVTVGDFRRARAALREDQP